MKGMPWIAQGLSGPCREKEKKMVRLRTMTMSTTAPAYVHHIKAATAEDLDVQGSSYTLHNL
jgi:hypothetical protein